MAQIDISATSFLPGSFGVSEVRGAVLAEMRNKQSKKMIEFHNQTIRTWQDPPEFLPKFKYAGGEIELWTVATGTELEIWKWIWLDEGTRVRHAILSDDWISKTQPGQLVAGAGRGRVKGVNKNYIGAGIQPRDFAEQIAKEMDKTLADDIQAAINRGLDLAEAKGKSIGF